MSAKKEEIDAKVVGEGIDDKSGYSLVWDDSEMQTVHANVCNVLGTKEEFMILFGTNQSWKKEDKEIHIKLSNRMTLNPYTTKRLFTMLGLSIKQYEDKFGEIKF